MTTIRGTCSYCRREFGTHGHPDDPWVRLANRHLEWLGTLHRDAKCPGSNCPAILNDEQQAQRAAAFRSAPKRRKTKKGGAS